VPGYLLAWNYMWRASPVCRSSSITISPMDASFSKRFTRVPATGCYSPVDVKVSHPWLDWFRPAEARAMGAGFGAYNTTAPFNSINPTAFKVVPPNIVHPDPKINKDYQAYLNENGNPKNPSTWYCNYQCMGWQEVAFNSLVSDLGMIFAGAAVVVGLVDSCTASVGWSFVTEDTTVDTLKHLREVSTHYGWAPSCLRGLVKSGCKFFYKSRCFCAVQLIALDMGARLCAKTVDVDGYYTVDYYVTMVLCQALFMALTLRFWSPYTCNPVIYTKNMWTQGTDDFLDLTVDPPAMKTIDLYEWIHLTRMQRLDHVTTYARRVGLDSIKDKPLGKQHTLSNADIKVKERKWVEVEDSAYKCFHSLHKCVAGCLYCRRHEIKTKKQKADKPEGIEVICINSHWDLKKTTFERDGHQIELKKKVHIPRDTPGRVTGKTSDGKLTVKWKINDDELVTNCEPLYISQYNERWRNFLKESGLDHQS